ncbi:unnamed protein product [Macrosiphum euphorbiae]|uniref:Uncharacterized protein n=1 Tax=Macrosiphum euphorbiae TaxID=13131 RepID=A0AAV0VFF8_9HEMI|nr:unnamed protein product [Macrosiphum euphorbiae]
MLQSSVVNVLGSFFQRVCMLMISEILDYNFWDRCAVGSLLGFKMAITLDSCQDLGMLLEFTMFVASVAIHLVLLGPRFFRNSGSTPPVPAAFPFYTDLSAFRTSSPVKSVKSDVFSLHRFSSSKSSFLTSIFSLFWGLILDVLNSRLAISLAATLKTFLDGSAAACFLKRAQIFLLEKV